MAELHESLDDPVILSNKINNVDDENDTEIDNAPNVIDDIYKSMSKVIEALNMDNIILNKQIIGIRSELEFICNTLAAFKSDIQETYSNDLSDINKQLCSLRINELAELKKKSETITDLQKHIMETRNILLQTLDINLKTIKKELNEIKQSRDITVFRNSIRNIIDEEMKTYMAGIPSLEKKFETLEKEQRQVLSNHIRKSMTQFKSSSDHDVTTQIITDEMQRLYNNVIQPEIISIKQRLSHLEVKYT